MSTKQWTAAEIPDQTGRTALVTGANSGLGIETARALAGRGAHVIMTARSEVKGREAAEDIAPAPLARTWRCARSTWRTSTPSRPSPIS